MSLKTIGVGERYWFKRDDFGYSLYVDDKYVALSRYFNELRDVIDYIYDTTGIDLYSQYDLKVEA